MLELRRTKMLVTPAINCKDYASARGQIKTAAGFLSEGGWIHIDVVDGLFAPVVTWGNPDDLKKIRSAFPQINFEIHLMVNNPKEIVESWLASGAKRLIVHVESGGDFGAIRKSCLEHGAEAMISGGPEVSTKEILSAGRDFDHFQILAVNPGFAGQKLGGDSIKKIEFLRAARPNAKIEVDGGINQGTARLAKAAGADILISASYIFESADPAAAYRKLSNI